MRFDYAAVESGVRGVREDFHDRSRGATRSIVKPSAHAGSITLGTAGSFGVLVGSTVTNTGSSVIAGNVCGSALAKEWSSHAGKQCYRGWLRKDIDRPRAWDHEFNGQRTVNPY